MATQLSEITRMHPMKISEAHERVKSLAWEPKYQPILKYPTDYKLDPKFAPTDLMKQVLRSYFPMQEEKDNRVFGTLDGALRGGMFRDVQPRWVEWMKFFMGFMPFPEISAARAMALLANVVPSNEIKNGLSFQMIDEVRHGTQQMALKKWYMENYIDPAGFDITEKAFGKCYATTIARQFGEGFIAGDAITAGNIFLQVVAETAFTNVLFVAMPSEAARNGLLPADRLPVHAVRRVAPHQQRLRYPADAAPASRELPAPRARPPLRLVAEPPHRRRRHRCPHRVRDQESRQEEGELRRAVEALGVR